MGVSEAKGEYIAEFESDDYVALHAYERLYNTAKSHHADVVRCNWVEFSSEEEVERDILKVMGTLVYFGKSIQHLRMLFLLKIVCIFIDKTTQIRQ